MDRDRIIYWFLQLLCPWRSSRAQFCTSPLAKSVKKMAPNTLIAAEIQKTVCHSLMVFCRERTEHTQKFLVCSPLYKTRRSYNAVIIVTLPWKKQPQCPSQWDCDIRVQWNTIQQWEWMHYSNVDTSHEQNVKQKKPDTKEYVRNIYIKLKIRKNWSMILKIRMWELLVGGGTWGLCKSYMFCLGAGLRGCTNFAKICSAVSLGFV